MNIYPERESGVRDLVQDLTNPSNKGSIPLLAEKIRILVTGKLQDHSVIARGNAWFPETSVVNKFKAVIGEEVCLCLTQKSPAFHEHLLLTLPPLFQAWNDIDLEIRSNVAIHVYRESDIPNRHGHCNSNPFIPNWLRAKLGMPPLPQKATAQRRRPKSHLTR